MVQSHLFLKRKDSSYTACSIVHYSLKGKGSDGKGWIWPLVVGLINSTLPKGLTLVLISTGLCRRLLLHIISIGYVTQSLPLNCNGPSAISVSWSIQFSVAWAPCCSSRQGLRRSSRGLLSLSSPGSLFSEMRALNILIRIPTFNLL